MEDLGEQRQVHGLPKGAVYFHKVALPVESLLSGLVTLDDKGKVESKITPQHRVTAYMDRMTYSQVALGSCALGLAKAGLHIAVRFARHRWTSGETRKAITPLFVNQPHQQALVPLVARTFAYNCAHNLVKRQFVTSPSEESSIMLANLAKARLTDSACDVLHIVASCMGTLGLSVYSRIQEYQHAAQVYTCGAGNNRALTVKACLEILRLQK